MLDFVGAGCLLGLAGIVSACGGDDSSAADDACTTNCGTDTGGDDGATGSVSPDGSGDADSDGSGDGAAGEGIPCDVREALAANCWTCHGATPQFGAPMSLATAEDFLVPAVTDATQPVHDLVGVRIASDDNPMPADGSLSVGDEATIAAWVADGAPESTDECEDSPVDPPDDPVGPEALPCDNPLTFTAHGEGTAPFEVPLVDNLYRCFTFSGTLDAETHITSWAPIVDDARVLHHWILYGSETPQEDGGAGPCNMPEDSKFLAGWAPGGGNFEMPEGVGLEFGGPNSSYTLQLHYNNTGGYDDAMDNSGVAVCPSAPLEETAGVIWLGTTGLEIPPGAVGHEEYGTCSSSQTSALPTDLNIIASFPHMHELGRALTTTIARGGPGGEQELLVDADPFMFTNQIMYPHDPPVVINAGDELVTRCAFDNDSDNTVTFGEDTEDEMCYNFVVAYPVDQIPASSRLCVSG